MAADLRQAYQLPSYAVATGKEVNIGIVMASPVSSADIETYFQTMGAPAPTVNDIKISGGGKLGGDSTGEATLDVQQSGGMAPQATIYLFDIPALSNQFIYAAYSEIAKPKAGIIVNSSFGGCETQFKNNTQQLKSFDSVFKQGLASGVTWVAASGDHGALNCGSNDNAVGVSWPAVSPYVLAVGGTNLTTAYAKGNDNSNYKHEDAFADVKPSDGVGDYWGSGGGYSVMYSLPTWQKGFVSKKGRGVPDVAVHMGGEGFSSGGNPKGCEAQKCNKDDSSDLERLGGQWTQSIGTSAACPDFVGYLAQVADINKSYLGFVNAELYTAAKKKPGYFFRKGLKGDNPLKTASGLWDPVLGLGTPYGARLAGVKDVAGTPGSPSNP
jgi:hypothetical protein